jgi:hypothetical protein
MRLPRATDVVGIISWGFLDTRPSNQLYVKVIESSTLIQVVVIVGVYKRATPVNGRRIASSLVPTAREYRDN